MTRSKNTLCTPMTTSKDIRPGKGGGGGGGGGGEHHLVETLQTRRKFECGGNAESNVSLASYRGLLNPAFVICSTNAGNAW